LAITPLSNTQRASLESFLTYPLDAAGAAYLGARGLLGVASDLRFGVVSGTLPREHPHRMFAGRLLIPSFSARGTIVDVAFRCIARHDCKEAGCPKYLFAPGSTKRLYHVQDVNHPSSTIHILEGQLNAATLVAAGEAAVGCSGADAWKAHYWRLFQGFDRVLVWRDGDDKDPKPLADGTPRKKGGDLFTDAVRKRLPHAEIISCPPGYDANSLFVEHGPEALLALVDHDVSGDSYDGNEAEDFILDADEKGEDIDDYPPPPF
jgi:hypothetical protein